MDEVADFAMQSGEPNTLPSIGPPQILQVATDTQRCGGVGN